MRGLHFRQSDFRGLSRLRDKLGTRFRLGVVLYAGQGALPFGDRLLALSHSAVWAAGDMTGTVNADRGNQG